MRSDTVDHVVRRVCSEAAQAAGRETQRDLTACAVVALGGYGRRELSPCSDVDLLFLHSGSPAPSLAAFVERVLMTLWDAGLSVGHSFRSRERVRGRGARRPALAHRAVRGAPGGGQRGAVPGARAAARDGAARQPLGARSLPHARCCASGPSGCSGTRKPSACWSPRSRRARAACATCTPCCWVAHARYGIRGLAGARGAPACSTRADVKALRAGLRLPAARAQRGALHDRPQGRPADARPARRGRDAPRLPGARGPAGLRAADARLLPPRVPSSTRCAARSWSRELEPKPRRRLFAALRLPARRAGTTRGHGALQLRAASGAAQRSRRARGVRARPGGHAAVARAQDGAAREGAARCGRGSREGGEMLLRVASHRGRVAPTFRALHETGVLQRLIPEWARITFLVQHDFFHKYTVDEHTLRAVEALDELVAGRDPQEAALARIFDELEDVRPLYLGMLLHDIAKGRGGGHVAKGVRGRAPHAGPARDRRRDRGRGRVPGRRAPRDVADLAAARPQRAGADRRVRGPRRHPRAAEPADAAHLRGPPRAWAPGSGTRWKASLLWELYGRTRRELEARREGRPRRGAARERDRAAAELRARVPGGRGRAPLRAAARALPARDRAPSGSRSHFRLLRARGERKAAFAWADLGDGHGSELTVTRRRPAGPVRAGGRHARPCTGSTS